MVALLLVKIDEKKIKGTLRGWAKKIEKFFFTKTYFLLYRINTLKRHEIIIFLNSLKHIFRYFKRSSSQEKKFSEFYF